MKSSNGETGMRFHHAGIACSDMDAAIRDAEALYGVKRRSDVIFDPEQNAHLCLIETATGMALELIAGQQVSGFVKRGITCYHHCHEVSDLEQEIARLSAAGATLVSSPRPAILFGGRRVAFLMTRLGMIELLEEA